MGGSDADASVRACVVEQEGTNPTIDHGVVFIAFPCDVIPINYSGAIGAGGESDGINLNDRLAKDGVAVGGAGMVAGGAGGTLSERGTTTLKGASQRLCVGGAEGGEVEIEGKGKWEGITLFLCCCCCECVGDLVPVLFFTVDVMSAVIVPLICFQGVVA